MKKPIITLFKSLFLGILLLSTGSCTPRSSRPLTTIKNSALKGIVNYDVFFEIDPAQKIFRSQQRVTITGNLAEGRKLSIFIGDGLTIDRLTLEDDAGNNLPIQQWEKGDGYSIDYFGVKIEFAEIEIQAEDKLPTQNNLIVSLDYHLPEDAFRQGLMENMYKLFISPEGSQAGGPESGAFIMVSGNLEAPMTITMTHPDIFRCAAPGEQVSLEEARGTITVTYQADNPYDPSFSCAPYKVISKEIEGMRIELFTPSDVSLSPKMLNTAAKIISYYQEKFGKPPVQSFRIIFPKLINDDGGGESNGNIVFLGSIHPFLNYDEDIEAQDMFAHLIAHEGYHLWNSWGLNWEGTLEEWWVEGGATFMSSWTNELLFGNKIGANYRLQNLKSFDQQEAYRYKKSLASLDDNWFEKYDLVYVYGAMVWEQLRQKVGSEALITGLSDFFEVHGNQTTNYADFIACMQKHTKVDVAEYLKQWTEHNAQIDLLIKKVVIQPMGGKFAVQVEVEVAANRDYELFTALGYKTSSDGEWQLIDLHLTKAGSVSIQFECDEMPLEIQVDPEYRVPQIKPDDNTWIDSGIS